MEIEKSKELLRQTINLRDFLGHSPTDQEAQEFYDRAIEEIIERTQEGFDRNGRRFPSYTEEYADFKGVGINEVDLTLFGDMLLSIRGRRDGDNIELLIDGTEAPKAFGHVSGYEGHPTITDGPKRDFFGITEGEARAIATDVESRPEIPSISSVFAAGAGAATVDEVIDALGLDFDDVGF